MSKGVYSNKKEKIIDYEYTQLIMLSTLGMLLLVSSRDLIIMYLSIETVSLSLYILAAIRKTGQLSTEAGLKYFILGALSSGLLLFGCALIYITTGLIDFNSLTYFIYNNISNNLVGIEIGAIFIIFAILFKLAAAPFHM
jgi:NADH-quinone oxidoreductase subunit N